MAQVKQFDHGNGLSYSHHAPMKEKNTNEAAVRRKHRSSSSKDSSRGPIAVAASGVSGAAQ